MSVQTAAWVMRAAGPADSLELTTSVRAEPADGDVLIKVMAFGINRLEINLREHPWDGFSLPRVLGIEAVGTVVACPDGSLAQGATVIAAMSGMGMTRDGGYAEHLVVPRGAVVEVRTTLGWDVLGALPEMLQTAYGALMRGAGALPGDAVLVRGGTTAVGRAAAEIARWKGMTVFATSRQPERLDALRAAGVAHPIHDDGDVAAAVRELTGGRGVQRAVELVGLATVRDTLRAMAPGGVACVVGGVGGGDGGFSPMGDIPHLVSLAGYHGDTDDVLATPYQEVIDAIEAGDFSVPLDAVFAFEELPDALGRMERGESTGKVVVLGRGVGSSKRG
jgi:NADPH2:quinone reductase